MVNVGVRKEGGMAKRMVDAEKCLPTKSSERFGFNLRINSKWLRHAAVFKETDLQVIFLLGQCQCPL